jgi:hypothetical protein
LIIYLYHPYRYVYMHTAKSIFQILSSVIMQHMCLTS